MPYTNLSQSLFVLDRLTQRVVWLPEAACDPHSVTFCELVCCTLTPLSACGSAHSAGSAQEELAEDWVSAEAAEDGRRFEIDYHPIASRSVFSSTLSAFGWWDGHCRCQPVVTPKEGIDSVWSTLTSRCRNRPCAWIKSRGSRWKSKGWTKRMFVWTIFAAIFINQI